MRFVCIVCAIRFDYYSFRYVLFVADSIGWDSIVYLTICMNFKHSHYILHPCDEIIFIWSNFEMILAFYPLYLALICAQLVNTQPNTLVRSTITVDHDMYARIQNTPIQMGFQFPVMWIRNFLRSIWWKQ